MIYKITTVAMADYLGLTICQANRILKHSGIFSGGFNKEFIVDGGNLRDSFDSRIKCLYAELDRIPPHQVGATVWNQALGAVNRLSIAKHNLTEFLATQTTTTLADKPVFITVNNLEAVPIDNLAAVRPSVRYRPVGVFA